MEGFKVGAHEDWRWERRVDVGSDKLGDTGEWNNMEGNG